MSAAQVFDHAKRTEHKWTDAEKAILQMHYRAKGARALLTLLPTRTLSAIVSRAVTMGLTKSPEWTSEEIAKLRVLYLSLSPSELERAMGRSANACSKKAMQLGLGGAKDLHQGKERISEAARRHGYAFSEMKRILRWGGVDGVRLVVNPAMQSPRGKGIHRWYDVIDVDDAVTAWCSSETPGEAAERVGVASQTLRQWLREAKVPGDPTAIARQAQAISLRRKGAKRARRVVSRKEWRIAREVIDEVVKARVRSDNLRQAAARLGLHRTTLGKIAKAEGVTRAGGVYAVRPEDFDAALARWRARKVKSAMAMTDSTEAAE